jgi:hypothetical protein
LHGTTKDLCDNVTLAMMDGNEALKVVNLTACAEENVVVEVREASCEILGYLSIRKVFHHDLEEQSERSNDRG